MNALPIKNVEDAMQVGKILCMSGWFSVETPEAGAAVALMIHQEGMTLLQFKAKYHIMGSGPTMRADYMVAEFMRLGGKVDIVERTDECAKAKFTAEGGKEHTFAFTMEDAKKSGICYKRDLQTLQDQWRIRPKNMLWARLVSDSIRTIDPRVNAGHYASEEMDELEEAKGTPSTLPGRPQVATATDQPEADEPKHEAPEVEPSKATDDDPFAGIETDPVDYSVCPVGKNRGKAWLDLPHELLAKVVKEKPIQLTKKHIAAAQEALEKIPY